MKTALGEPRREVTGGRRRGKAGRAATRPRPAACVLALVAFLSWGEARARASQDSGVSLEIAAPPELRAGATASIEVVVRVARGQEQAMLLTPSAEGEALRVVRGRLLRRDATRATDGSLRFAVPVVAKVAGTAVLKIELLTYACTDAEGCRAVRLAERTTLEVRGS